MIFSTSSQLNCFLIFVFLGIVLSIVSNAINILFLEKFAKKLKKIIINFNFYAIFSIFFVIFINVFNFGEFSISLLIASTLGFIWFNFTTKKLVVFLSSLWYTKLTKGKLKHARKKN